MFILVFDEIDEEIITFLHVREPKLESEPLYLYSCITSPQPWFKLMCQPRASTQGVKINWRVHRKQSVFGKLVIMS